MSDIVEQLRECAKRQLAIAPSYIDKSLEWLAADEIERLQADNASLRAALQTQSEEAAKLTTQREELLAALKRVLPEISVCCSTEMLEQCREAIANATT